MKLHRRVKHFIIYLLAFLMAFEPFAVNMVLAADGPDSEEVISETEAEKKITTVEEEMQPKGLETGNTAEEIQEKIDEFTKGDGEYSIVLPVDYLDHMYKLRGLDRPTTGNLEEYTQAQEALVWGEWLQMMSSTYQAMDDGCSDVFSFYNTLDRIQSSGRDATYFFKALQFATSKALMVGHIIAKFLSAKITFIGNVGKTLQKGANMIKGFGFMGAIFSKGAKFASTANNFFSHLTPPQGFRKGCEPGDGFGAYIRWIARKTGKDGKFNTKITDKVKEINKHLPKDNRIQEQGFGKLDSQGYAETLGIAMSVLSIAVNAYGIFSSDDAKAGIKGGRLLSYPRVKNYMAIIWNTLKLVGMFIAPPFGAIIVALASIWDFITYIGDKFGEYNKRWKNAYKNSFQYLYENDPEFKSYYDNRDDLTNEEKSSSYLMLEEYYGELKDMARAFEKNFKGSAEYYKNPDDENLKEQYISSRLYIEMEKQGVLTSYYNKADFKLNNLTESDREKIWKAKASYMAWKPTEEEAALATDDGFLDNLLKVVNPMTYIGWAGDKINTARYNSVDKKFAGLERVQYNPDFTLIKSYVNYVTNGKKIVNPQEQPENNNDFYRALGLRMEQCPFNYIPLAGLDYLSQWDDDLLVEAFNADSFIVGTKEMMYFRNIIGAATANVKAFKKELTKKMGVLYEHAEIYKDHIDALTELHKKLVNKSSRNDKADRAFFNTVKSAFPSWKKENKNLSYMEILNRNWGEINMFISNEPITISYDAADLQLLLESIKKNLDLAVLIQDLYNQKQDALNNFENEFSNIYIKDFLKENSFLGVKGGGILDWLSDIYPPYKELKKYSELYKKEADKFSKAADATNEGQKKVLFFIPVKDDKYHPKNVIATVDNVLSDYKRLISDFEELLQDSDFNGKTLSITERSQEELDKIFPPEGYSMYAGSNWDNIKSLDVDKEIVVPEVTEE